MQHDTIAVLDYGSQYSQLICRRVREANVYAEMISWDRAAERLPQVKLRGIILSGGPASVYEAGAPTLPDVVLKSGVPVLGICYGLQLLAHALGGHVAPSAKREYGAAEIEVTGESRFFGGQPRQQQVWMSHGDRVERLPAGFETVARSGNSPCAAIADEDRSFYGIQVSSGGGAYAQWFCDAAELCGPDLRLHGGLDIGSFHRGKCRRDPGAGRAG